ncbi:MAG: hypothetical protein V7672_14265 [Brevundimonas sp.]|uniref:hypothetical protein n=1 Tax=Brevundimonas sp. TaxID=1871086 RepID=UPI003001F788
MSHAKIATLAGSALALAFLTATPTLAQDSRGDVRSGGSPGEVEDQANTEGRVAGQRQDRERWSRRGRQRTGPSPEEVMADASAVAAVAVPTCQVTESSLLGQREDETKLYEIACATGPGYILVATADAPTAADCVLQSSLAWQLRQENPEADAGLQCTLPGNQNRVEVITAYGQQAGVSCQTDEAVAWNTRVYELGCAGADGYRLEKSEAGSWSAMPCWRYALIASDTCKLTTAEESRLEWPKLVANTEIAACNIEDVSWMGDNPERGAFYELKCSTGEGVIVRFHEGATQQVYSCVDAVQIFSKPCSLTTVPASTEPEAAPAE